MDKGRRARGDAPRHMPSSQSDSEDEGEYELDDNPEAALWRNDIDGDDGHEDGDGAPSGGSTTPVMSVYVTIHRVRRLVVAAIDDPYTLEQLRAPRLDMLVVRPLADRLYNAEDPSIVYCLLANRVQFLRSQSDEEDLYQTLNIARATLCELVAARVLRRFHEDHPDRPGLLLLANVLVSGFDPFYAAPEHVRREGRSLKWPGQERRGQEQKLTALELAILSESKILIGSLACQRVVNAVHRGLVVYTPLSFVDILPDHYKHHPVSLYEPRRASILNHRRLIVPRLRNLIELAHFTTLLLLYVLTMTHRNEDSSDKLGIYEAVFVVFTAGWILEQFAAIIEHGWEVHAQNLWSFLDITFILIFGVYGVVRTFEIWYSPDDYFALPVLCIAAPILLTRIACNLMPDNIVFIALHAMMRDFTRLTFIALWCFTGFLLGLVWLMRTADDASDSAAEFDSNPNWATIGKWLLWIWFGLDGTGIERTADFHFILGPALAITFAFLGNTLFLTILVAILTNTFSKIIANETAEIQFRRAVLTFQGVKSDSIFAYPPPFNMAALVVMLPLKFVVRPSTFHHVNVAVIKFINCPVLLLIALYERRRVWARTLNEGGGGGAGRTWHFGLSPYGDIQAVFRAEPPPEVMEALERLDPIGDASEGGGGSRGGMEQEVMAGRSSTDLELNRVDSNRNRLAWVRRRKPSAESVAVSQ
ncbi:hypothetical protein B0T17DRAFT_519280 [Bombardia bombarda]|uniref:Calcium channel YVC1 n=1 Tax=Bombardia bombarda TaxID=252184 RepID=A0AA39XM82_9PEZI|nr:hypothetical protein B0T17DRAFT_519280 [Bombardia bombarda]